MVSRHSTTFLAGNGVPVASRCNARLSFLISQKPTSGRVTRHNSTSGLRPLLGIRRFCGSQGHSSGPATQMCCLCQRISR